MVITNQKTEIIFNKCSCGKDKPEDWLECSRCDACREDARQDYISDCKEACGDIEYESEEVEFDNEES